MTLLKVDRSRLPALGERSGFSFPSIRKSVLPSGLRVWSVRHAAVPVVSFMLLVRTGSAADPEGQGGLAALTADMLDEGSGDRSAIAMHEALARIGAQFDTDIGADATMVAVASLARFADRSLRLLADIVARPSLTEADFARVRQLRLHRLAQLRDMPGSVADRTFVRLLYGTHPYGHTPIGSESTVATLTIDDVRRFHREAIGPRSSTLIAVGECDHAEIERLAADAFDGWNQPTGHSGLDDRATRALPTQPARLVVVPRPGAPQSELRIGHVAVDRATPDYHALVAANMVLGGQFVSRINLNLREDKGFTYGARTAFDFRRLPGPFSLQVSVQSAATAEAIKESIDEISAIRGSRPVTRDELSLGIAALTRGYARNFETAEQVARAATQIALYDLPDDYFVQFVPKVESVTTAEVSRVAAEHLHPERLLTLIVGDLEVVGKDLDSLDLDEPLVLSPDSL